MSSSHKFMEMQDIQKLEVRDEGAIELFSARRMSMHVVGGRESKGETR